jgi:hypothetical protein
MELSMKKFMQILFLSFTLCSETFINIPQLHAMSSPVDGLEAPKSFDRAVEKLWWWAVINNHTQIVRTLIFLGVDPDAFKIYNRTALSWASSPRNLEMMKILIKAHANPNARTADGMTILGYTAADGSVETVKLLINALKDKNNELIKWLCDEWIDSPLEICTDVVAPSLTLLMKKMSKWRRRLRAQPAVVHIKLYGFS